MGNRQDREPCRQLPWCDDAVAAVTSLDAYAAVLAFLFEDGKVNQGRLHVLKLYTQEVCTRHPHLAAEIERYYETDIRLRTGASP